MSALPRRLLPLLALVAVACMAVGGQPRGFLCDCFGVIRAAAGADCDHVHGPECEHPDAPHHGQPDHQGEHETELAPFLGSLDSVPTVLPTPAWFVCWLPWLPGEGHDEPGLLTTIGEASRPPPTAVPRPWLAWSAILPHTIALRI